MDFDGDTIKVAFFLIVLVVSILGPLVQKVQKKFAQNRQPAPPEPGEEPEQEPMLPYEDLVEQVFKPYIEKRRQEHLRPVEVIPSPEEPGRVSTEREVLHAIPIPPHRPEGTREKEVPSRSSGHKLEKRLFSNPRLTPGQKLLLASEIMRTPRALSGRGRIR